jgi:hypothetical protein
MPLPVYSGNGSQKFFATCRVKQTGEQLSAALNSKSLVNRFDMLVNSVPADLKPLRHHLLAQSRQKFSKRFRLPRRQLRRRAPASI